MILGARFLKVFKEFGDEMNSAAKRELGTRRIGKNSNYGVASRKLQRSLSVVMQEDPTIRLEFFALPPADRYAEYIHDGVNGTQVDRGSQFSYGEKMPPIDAIRGWMRVKPVRLRDAKGKFIEQTEKRLDAAAYRIARAIQRKGIEGLRYYEVAFDSIFPRFEKKLADAAEQDTADYTQDMLDDTLN